MDVVAVCGSLRAGSFNRKLLRHLASRAGEGVTFEILELRGIPVYDGDLETAAFPPEVTAFKDRVARADALVLGSPEYNWSLPGPLKNAIDWASRPPADIPRVFGGKRVGIVGATPGAGGTRLAQTAWLPVMRTLGANVFPDAIFVAQAGSVFDESGAMIDPKTLAVADKWLGRFVEFARR